MQEHDVVGKYVSSEMVGGNKVKDTNWYLTSDHKAIQDDIEMGLWHIDGDKVVITYYAKLLNIATLEPQNGNFIGVNIHTNGASFKWIMQKIQKHHGTPDGWTFAIPTNGITKFHKAVIESIRAQKIPNYEIIFCTENKEYKLNEPDIRVIHIGNEKSNWISKKKNEMTRAAKHQVICYMHDYVTLADGWYEGFEKFGYNWDVCQNRLHLPDGGRLRDWMSLDHPDYRHGLIPYTLSNITNRMYVSGTYWCAWKSFMLQWPLDENRCHRENEDGEWSCRIRRFWDLKFNPHSVARCLRKSNV